MRVLHETIGQLRNMDKPVLVHTDIDEGPKGGNVRDRAFQQHARLEVGDFVHAFSKGCRLEAWTRVTARLFQFGNDVLDRRQTKLLVDELLRIERL